MSPADRKERPAECMQLGGKIVPPQSSTEPSEGDEVGTSETQRPTGHSQRLGRGDGQGNGGTMTQSLGRPPSISRDRDRRRTPGGCARRRCPRFDPGLAGRDKYCSPTCARREQWREDDEFRRAQLTPEERKATQNLRRAISRGGLTVPQPLEPETGWHCSDSRPTLVAAAEELARLQALVAMGPDPALQAPVFALACLVFPAMRPSP